MQRHKWQSKRGEWQPSLRQNLAARGQLLGHLITLVRSLRSTDSSTEETKEK
jgi:hypothetical protein